MVAARGKGLAVHEAHPAVLEVGVIGMPDSVEARGEGVLGMYCNYGRRNKIKPICFI
jgi:hypothetical protein